MPSWLSSLPVLTDPALLALRLVVGSMFLLSGFFKLVDADRRKRMADSLQEAGLPGSLGSPLALVELLGGLGLVLGVLTVPSALGLLVISVGALVTTSLPRADGRGIHKLENVLYMPEALLPAALLALLAVGPGGWSLDLLWR